MDIHHPTLTPRRRLVSPSRVAPGHPAPTARHSTTGTTGTARATGTAGHSAARTHTAGATAPGDRT
ncbi:hypothetical protein, partial [Kribbella sp. NPDC006257]|uniref:hypothetical protein n=1 Tax=Kribbella sp. NPDC006257 TaxID=3156738 RepID=UPI0033A26E01